MFSLIETIETWNSETLQNTIKGFIQENGLSFGNILPLVRIATSGTMKGPDVFEMMALLDKADVVKRLREGLVKFDAVKEQASQSYTPKAINSIINRLAAIRNANDKLLPVASSIYQSLTSPS